MRIKIDAKATFGTLQVMHVDATDLRMQERVAARKFVVETITRHRVAEVHGVCCECCVS